MELIGSKLVMISSTFTMIQIYFTIPSTRYSNQHYSTAHTQEKNISFLRAEQGEICQFF